MIIWEGHNRHEFSPAIVSALKALGVGYGHIKAMHGAFLGTFHFCYRGTPEQGYVITTEGRKALEICGDGHEFDPRSPDGKHQDKTDRTEPADAGTGG
jgi:hypothetical protein